jgi:hypothetical protein
MVYAFRQARCAFIFLAYRACGKLPGSVRLRTMAKTKKREPARAVIELKDPKDLERLKAFAGGLKPPKTLAGWAREVLWKAAGL